MSEISWKIWEISWNKWLSFVGERKEEGRKKRKKEGKRKKKGEREKGDSAVHLKKERGGGMKDD